MLKEYLDSSATTEIQWQEIIVGFDLCRIEMQSNQTKYPIVLNPVINPETIEIFLCFHGSLMLEPKKGAPITVTNNEIFILSDDYTLNTARIATPLSGLLIVVNADKIDDSLNKLNQLFLNHKSINISKQHVIADKQMFSAKHACCVLGETEWSHSFFTALNNYSLELNQQSNYSVFKLLELFYLIHTENAVLKNKTSENNSNGYLIQTINHIKEYMETHLEDHLTIDFLSEKFHISATTLKTTFRKIYGQPVHRWLQIQRMKRAAKLLYTSNMTVIQIAQAVGYDGVSQFNVIFKRYYGVTPGQYRKMSNSIEN